MLHRRAYRGAAAVALLICELLVCSSAGAQTTELPQAAASAAETPAPSQLDSLWKVYEQVKEGSSQLDATDAYHWLKQDLQNMLTWDYRVLSVTLEDEQALAATLNELGRERWECVEAVPRGNRLLLIFKRPTKSYAKHLPLKELLKLIPAGE